MTIVTQEKDLINYDTIKLVSIYAGTLTIEDDENKEKEIYTLLAFDNNCDVSDLDEAVDGAIQLGVFTDSKQCNGVLDKLIASIVDGEPLFQVPQPYGSLV